MKKLILLDFDDTLCMTEELCFHAENQIIGEMGFPPMSRDIHQANWGMKLEEAIPLRVPGIDVADFMARFKQIVMANIGAGDKVPDKNLETLDKLKGMGYRLGILTSRNRLEMTGVLQAKHSLATRVEAFYYLENCTHHKPDPRVFDNALRDLKVTADEVIYVGDSLGDAAASIGAGMTFIATLESGIRSREEFELAGAKFFVDRLEDLVAVIEGLEAECIQN